MRSPLTLIAFLAAPTLAATILLPAKPELSKEGFPAGWEAMLLKKVPRQTQYAWSAKAGALHAVSADSASGLIRGLSGPANETPVLRWRWKISGVLPGGDARKKSGDDYAARVYVTFQYDPQRASFGMRVKYRLAKALYGEYPPHAGINYIWANKLPKGTDIVNAYTNRVRMVAVRSGDSDAGVWRSEERNIVEDYRRLFGEEPPPLAGIAVMTDSDNTHGSAEAWYANIELGKGDDK